MKVLHIIPSISTKRGGPSKAILGMVKGLRDIGIEASILTTSDSCIYQDRNYPLHEWFLVESIPVLMFPTLNSRNDKIREFLFSPSYTTWLMRNIQTYDLLHIHAIFSYPSSIAMLFARLTRKPYIVRTIGQLNEWSLSQSYRSKKYMLDLVERKNLDSAVAIHVTSELEVNDLKQFGYRGEILSLGLGVDLPVISRNERESTLERTNFIFLSRLHPKKQLELLLEAFSIIRNEAHEKTWRLTIAGDGDPAYVKYLKKQSQDLGIADYISWVGHISGIKKDEVLKEADWFVLPSASENFGISAVEAMANSVPVIITETVGIAEKVREHGAGIISSSSPLELARVLRKAMGGPSLEMKQAARSMVEKQYSWNKICTDLSDYYHQIIAIPKAR